MASVNVHCPQFLVALVGLKADELDVVENLFLVGGNLWVGYAAECLHKLWSHLSVDNFEIRTRDYFRACRFVCNRRCDG